MSAALLRGSACRMRHDGQRATQGRWKAWGMRALADQDGTGNVDTAVPVANTLCRDETGSPRTFDLDHIIGMQPAVALAVAEWLDRTAVDGDNGYDESDDNFAAALAVANAYLGVASS